MNVEYVDYKRQNSYLHLTSPPAPQGPKRDIKYFSLSFSHPTNGITIEVTGNIMDVPYILVYKVVSGFF
jgi:hypothetical protein